MASAKPSPFAQLSFTEQQEQWRVFRARHLDYTQVVQPVEQKSAKPERLPAYLAEGAPRHSNLDRVRAQLAAASRRAGAFQSVTSRE